MSTLDVQERIARVKAVDYNGKTFDDQPIVVVSGVGDWLTQALDEGRISIDTSEEADYANFRVATEDDYAVLARPGDWIVADLETPPNLDVLRRVPRRDKDRITPLDDASSQLLRLILDADKFDTYSDDELREAVGLVHTTQRLDEQSLYQLNQCWVSGPIVDGDLISKFHRTQLEELGAVTRIVVEGQPGYNACTDYGHRLLKLLKHRFPESTA